jgi:2'-5' RNA ligase
MSVIRAFIAIDIAPEILDQINRISADLNRKINNHAVRWVAVANIHLTLKFLGDVSLNNLELLTDALRLEAGNHPNFSISVGGMGAFPSVRRPRVLWIGVEGPEALVNLQRNIESQMARLGYEKDQRPFSPHLTLGRVSRNARPEEIRVVSQVVDAYKLGFIGITPVHVFHLYRSDLHPDGAIYTRILTLPLSG